MSITFRHTLAALGLVLVSACSTTPAPTPAAVPPAAPIAPESSQPFEQLEATFGARLGVYAVDTGSGREITYRGDESFAFASTYKALAAGAVLRRTPVEGLSRRISYRASDLVNYSPITSQHVADGLTLREVMDAALRYSDNTAGNLLFGELGGPAGFTAALRSLGDTTTRSDREETELNTAVPGDPRDTSTPRALAADLRSFAVGATLPADRRAVLETLMRTNTTGNELIRAGAPAGWQVADKTGNGEYATRNDIAVVYPPSRAPIVLAILSTRPQRDAPVDNKLVAQAASAALKAFE